MLPPVNVIVGVVPVLPDVGLMASVAVATVTVAVDVPVTDSVIVSVPVKLASVLTNILAAVVL